MQQQFDPESGSVNKLRFDTYAINLADLQKSRAHLPLEADERTLDNLWYEIHNKRLSKKTKKEYWGELHTRMTRPLYTLSFTLIAVVCLLAGAFNRRGQSKRIIFAVATLVTLQGIVLGLSNAATRSIFGIIGLYAISILPGLFALLVLRKQDRKMAHVSFWRMLFSPERLV
jgi:lipopolysaccharide export system permease protein